MDVGSVNSSSASAARQAAESQQSQEAARRQQKPVEQPETTSEAPRPVKNAEGQTTGSVVNVTA